MNKCVGCEKRDKVIELSLEFRKCMDTIIKVNTQMHQLSTENVALLQQLKAISDTVDSYINEE